MILAEKLLPVCTECYGFLPQKSSNNNSSAEISNKIHTCAICVIARFCSKSCRMHHMQNCSIPLRESTVVAEQLDAYIQMHYNEAAGRVYFLYSEEKKGLKEKRIGGRPIGDADLSVFVKIDSKSSFIGPYNYSYYQELSSNNSLNPVFLTGSLKTKYIFKILKNEFSTLFQTATLRIKKSFPQLVYLKLDDTLLLRMFDRFEELRSKKYSNAEIPPYYPEARDPFPNPIGGHISVITGYELKNSHRKNEILNQMESIQGKSFRISFRKVISTRPEYWKKVRKLWMVIFDSQELESIRTSLSLQLFPNGHEFHSTIAIKVAKIASQT